MALSAHVSQEEYSTLTCLPILLVSRVTVGTAALSANGTDVGVGAEAAGMPALPTAILSCMGKHISAA